MACLDQAISCTTIEVLPKDPWATCLHQFASDGNLFLFGCAGRAHHRGAWLFDYHKRQISQIPEVDGPIWDIASGKDGFIAMASDDGVIKAGHITAEKPFIGKLNSFHVQLAKDIKRICLNDDRRISILTSLEVLDVPLDAGFTGQASRLFPLNHYNSLPIHIEWSNTGAEHSLLAIATTKGGISILDPRQRRECLATKILAEDKSLGFAHWNPFIPYWLAATSYGASSNIEIYDLRYLKSDAMMKLSDSFVTDFAWSNSNVELLLATSSNNTSHLWNLRQSSQDGDDLQEWGWTNFGQKKGSCITRLYQSTKASNEYYGLALTGQLMEIKTNHQMLAESAPISHSGQMMEAEKSFYCRDFPTMFQRLVDCNGSKRIDEEVLSAAITRTKAPPIIKANTWNIAEKENSDGSFQGDLRKYSATLPPGYSLNIDEIQGPKLKSVIEGIQLKIKVIKATRIKDIGYLAGIVKTLVSRLQANPHLMELPVLMEIIRLLLESHRLDALHMGREILRNRPHQILDSDVCSLAHLLLYPTIFDPESLKIIPRHVDEPASFPSKIQPSIAVPLSPPTAQPNGPYSPRGVQCTSPTRISQLSGRDLLELRRALHSCRFESSKDNPQGINQLLDELSSLGKPIISTRLIWSEIDRFLIRSQPDLYLETLIKYGGNHLDTKSLFGVALLEDMQQRVFPNIKFILNQAVETNRPSLVIRSILLIVLLVKAASPLPAHMEPFLTERLHQLCKCMQREDYRQLKGYQRLEGHIGTLKPPKHIPNSHGTGIWMVLNQIMRQMSHSPSTSYSYITK